MPAPVPNPVPNTTLARSLRDLVATRIGHRWDEFAARHPHLAGVMDRTTLIETTVSRLRDDPAFVAAMRQANLDEAQLAAAARLLEQAERWVTRALLL